MRHRFAGPGDRRTRARSHDDRIQRDDFERVMGSRRGWRRLAKRAAAAYEREIAELAREVAKAAPPVLSVTSQPLRGRADEAVVTLSLSLPGWELQLSGVAATAASSVAEAPAGRHLRGTGRYGVFWWIELASAPGGEEPEVLLGSALRIFPAGDGAGGAAALSPELDLAVLH